MITSEAVFEIFFLAFALGAIAYSVVVIRILRKSGVDVNSPRIIFAVSLSGLLIGFFPFLLKAGLPWQFKIGIPLFSAAIAIIYGLSLMKARKKIRQLLDLDNQESKGEAKPKTHQ